MVAWRNFIFLFGGFQDTGIRTTYLNDLWAWSLTECVALRGFFRPMRLTVLIATAFDGTRSSSASSSASLRASV